MKDVTDAFHSLGCWSSTGSFGFNTDILPTNPMNPGVGKCVQVVYFKNSLHLKKLPEDRNLFEVPSVLLHYVVQHPQT